MTSQPSPAEIEVVITREQRRNLTLRPKPGLLLVRAPLLASDAEIAGFVARHQAWVRRHCAPKTASFPLLGKEVNWEAGLPGAAGFQPNPVERHRDRIHRRLCSAAARQVFDQTLSELGLLAPPLRIGSMVSAWGRCHASGRVELHWRVGSLPAHLARYVVCHELAHLKHLNHSRDFWAHLGTLDPQARRHDRELNAWHL